MKKILIIEDNPDIRDNTAEILELSNYTVFTAENGKVGIEQALQHMPDLIICDIMMPELDGFGVLHAIQRNESVKNTPFIFLTAKTEKGDFRKGMELGADDYITKPFDGTDLLNAVYTRLKKHDTLKEEFTSGLKGFQQLINASLGKNVLQSLTEDRNVNIYKKKQIIYSEGNHPNRLYYIISGKVKTYKLNDNGKELAMDLFTDGDFLGHVALLEKKVYKDSAVALEDSEIAIIPREDFEELMSTSKEVSQKFVQVLAKNITEKEEHLLAIAYNSLRKKVAEALLLVQSKYKTKSLENLPIHINRENLAAVAGTATESLIRTLSDFKNEKLIEIVNGNIIITNEKKLSVLPG
jgi:CRP/FNR family transcriptional regulator, cyclic AMP receptor protein